MSGWQPDPTGRHERRWWDGFSWTDGVADEGVVSVDEEHDFDSLPPAERTWTSADVQAYSVPERFARAFGRVTMPTEGLRCWEVAGEGRHQQELGLVAGPKTHDGRWVEKVATLQPEPENPYDDQAVAVRIDGRRVGYLPQGQAAAHRRVIGGAIAEHGRATCAAVVNGGWIRPEEDSEGSYGVRLYFGYRPRTTADELPEPGADEVRIPYRFSDEHDHVTVVGEEHHQEALAASLGPEWAGDHPYRLARLGVGEDPRSRPAVTVSLEGSVVGWLTPKMTARFRAAVEATMAEGGHLTAVATLEPSHRKGHEDEIDVVLRVPRGWGRTTPPEA